MNLFWKRLFGKLQNTERYEEEKKRLIADYKRYADVRESDLMKEYQELMVKVKSPDFKEHKKALTSRKYKDTEEYRDMRKFEKLDNNSDIKRYYEVLKNGTLAEYLAFKQKPDFAKLSDAKAVKQSPELTRLKSFERSKEYKIYTRFHNSYIIKEYEGLREKINTQEFKDKNSFWANPNRFALTPEYKLEQRFYELQKNADIVFFNQCNEKKFAFINDYEMIFHDSFSHRTMAESQWKAGFHYSNPELKPVHSFLNERQANNGGRNVKMNGNMCIFTKEEKVTASAWHPVRGFIPKEYDLTGDVVNGYDAIRVNKGLIRAKIRFTGSRDVSHAFWMIGKHKTPHINIVKCDNGRLEVGIYYNAHGSVQYTRETIKGINPQNWFYYELAWTNNELIWYINNVEVFRTSVLVPDEELFPMFNSFVPENRKGGAATFEVEYIDVFKFKE